MSATIKAGHRRGKPGKAPVIRDCGPEGCEIDWLSSQRHEAEIDDVTAFTQFSLEQGWGDGLPVIPPTEGRVACLSREEQPLSR